VDIVQVQEKICVSVANAVSIAKKLNLVYQNVVVEQNVGHVKEKGI